MRVKSLQLLVFKLASHKQNLLDLLETHKRDDLIPFDAFTDLMDDFSLVTSLVFMQYDQYVGGAVMRNSDPKALALIETFLQERSPD